VLVDAKDISQQRIRKSYTRTMPIGRRITDSKGHKNMTDVIHLAIYQSKNFTLQIEYELLGDVIEITNVDIRAQPVSDFEQRERTRRGVQRLYSKNAIPTDTPVPKDAYNASVWQTETFHDSPP